MPFNMKVLKETARKEREGYLRIFVLESPNVLDELQSRMEGPALEVICRLIGHEIITANIQCEDDFKRVVRYIAEIDPKHDALSRPKRPLCIHISAHGCNEGICLGPDGIHWPDVVDLVQPVLDPDSSYEGDRVFVLSSCNADEQKITDEIQKKVKNTSLRPPRYLFATEGEVAWSDAAVMWTVFYHLLPDTNLREKTSVQNTLKKIASLGVGRLKYFRWDEEKNKYLNWTPK